MESSYYLDVLVIGIKLSYGELSAIGKFPNTTTKNIGVQQNLDSDPGIVDENFIIDGSALYN